MSELPRGSTYGKQELEHLVCKHVHADLFALGLPARRARPVCQTGRKDFLHDLGRGLGDRLARLVVDAPAEKRQVGTLAEAHGELAEGLGKGHGRLQENGAVGRVGKGGCAGALAS